MRYYKIDVQGKMWLQRLAVPVWSADDEGRILYDTGGNEAYLGDDGGFGKIWTSRNDGAGSGLDSDLLDGQHGSYYWNPSNDGAGSGLDADLLDGQHGTYYLNATNINAGTLAAARLSGTYNINISGNAATATAARYS